MGGGDNNLRGPGGFERLGRLDDGSAGVDHVVNEEADATIHFTDDLVHSHLVRDERVTSLMDDRERRAQLVAPDVGNAHAAHVGRDDSEGGRIEDLLEVLEQHRHREQMVDGAIEEALDLGGVQVDAHDAVSPGRLVQVGDQSGADRLTTATLLVLAGVRVERGDDGDALCRGALERVDHDQLLHEPFVDRVCVRLDHERVAAANTLVVASIDLTVGEGTGIGVHDARLEFGSDVDGQLRVSSTADDHEPLLSGYFDLGHGPRSLPTCRRQSVSPNLIRAAAVDFPPGSSITPASTCAPGSTPTSAGSTTSDRAAGEARPQGRGLPRPIRP